MPAFSPTTGERIAKAVRQALTEALVRFDNYLLSTWGVSRGWSRGSPAIVRRTRPSFFIYSRYGGDHWTEWVPEGCPYYPCHNYPWQQCSFCYCPLYPCMDSALGTMIETPHGAVWSCMDCRLVHIPEVVNHLLKNFIVVDNVDNALKIAKKYDITVSTVDPGRHSDICEYKTEEFRFLEQIITECFPDVITAPYLSTGASDSRYFSDLSENCFRFAPFTVTDEQLDSMHAKDENIFVTGLTTPFKKFLTLEPNEILPSSTSPF